ncbi:MAG: tetratricopeptide repeat protein, partial [Candidatus Eisenbacteria bacterium]|nr:tetratricopeptide repeat protein [Candidatus Eisenbacteria bacterium]
MTRDRLISVAVCALVPALIVAGPTARAQAQDGPTAREAVERARALERSGHPGDAWSYLEHLVTVDDGPLAGEAEVLLEAARLADSSEQARALALRAIEGTRSARILYAARILRGDSYFAQAMYQTASREYEEASRHAPGRGPGAAELKRARSILASGDTEAAIVAYENIVGGSAAADDTR